MFHSDRGSQYGSEAKLKENQQIISIELSSFSWPLHDVTSYLNIYYYNFISAEPKNLSQTKVSSRLIGEKALTIKK